MKRRRATVVVLSLTFLFALDVRAAESGVAPAPTAGYPSATPAGLLAAADAAVGAGDLQLARALFERLVTEFPTLPEAGEARRALNIMAVQPIPAGRPPSPLVAPAGPRSATAATEDDDIVVRDEPYSRKTSERLRLSVWEKVDFGVTAFLYGMSLGFSLALSQDQRSDSDFMTPIALGAVTYTLGAVAFLNLANPDRGDLPLALAITSYIPTTTLLLISASDAHASSQTTGAATAITGLVSIPIAVLAARHFDLDPGDTQLVRDAGFWGLALSTMGMLGFGGRTVSPAYYDASNYEFPSGRKVAVAGLVGLYGGLGLGLLSASSSEISLERVRVTTWGGYGGAVVGILLGYSSSDYASREQGTYRGAAIGALAGLVITFLSTGSLDGIPDEQPTRTSWHRGLAPMVVQVAGTDGSVHPGFGFGGSLF